VTKPCRAYQAGLSEVLPGRLVAPLHLGGEVDGVGKRLLADMETSMDWPG